MSQMKNESNEESGARDQSAFQMKRRTKNFALRIIGLVDDLPAGRPAEVIGRQLLRSGTSVGANYRAACRAKSVADFIAKMGTVEEEADECIYWMELLTDAKILPLARLQPLMAEADELVAITVSSIKTAKANKNAE
jgi:four helix bundle protein